MRDGVAGEQPVAAAGEHRGEHPDRAARLKGGGVALRGQQGDGDRVLACLVPAVSSPYGSGEAAYRSRK
jgi:hypothetical protein